VYRVLVPYLRGGKVLNELHDVSLLCCTVSVYHVNSRETVQTERKSTKHLEISPGGKATRHFFVTFFLHDPLISFLPTTMISSKPATPKRIVSMSQYSSSSTSVDNASTGTSDSSRIVFASPVASSYAGNNSITPESDDSTSPDSRKFRWVDSSSSSQHSTAARLETPSSSLGGRKGDICRSELPVKRGSAGTVSLKANFLLHRMQRIESKVQKAACMELAYLKKVTEVQDKRNRWIQLHGVMTLDDLRQRLSCNSASPMSLKELNGLIVRINVNIEKMDRREKGYLEKSKEVRDKRFQWTKLYKISQELLLRQINSRTSSMNHLPPLLPRRAAKPIVIDLTE
jgi:hypothetical protein